MDKEGRHTSWRIENQTQTDHLRDYCSLNTSIRYGGGSFEVRQRIHDSAAGYSEGKARVELIAAAPEMADLLHDIVNAESSQWTVRAQELLTKIGETP